MNIYARALTCPVSLLNTDTLLSVKRRGTLALLLTLRCTCHTRHGFYAGPAEAAPAVAQSSVRATYCQGQLYDAQCATEHCRAGRVGCASRHAFFSSFSSSLLSLSKNWANTELAAVEHYRNVWNFVRVIHEAEDNGAIICNSSTCPRMSAGEYVVFRVPFERLVLPSVDHIRNHPLVCS